MMTTKPNGQKRGTKNKGGAVAGTEPEQGVINYIMQVILVLDIH